MNICKEKPPHVIHCVLLIFFATKHFFSLLLSFFLSNRKKYNKLQPILDENPM